MDKRLKKQIIFCVCFYFAFFAVLMIFGTFFDLEIDKALFNYENKFGIIMENWGMQAMYLVPLFAWSMLLSAYHPIDEAFDIAASIFPFFVYLKNNRATHFICFLLLHIMYGAFFYGAFMGSNDTLNTFMGAAFGSNLQDLLTNAGVSRTIAIILWAILRILLVAFIVFFFRKTDKKYKKALEFMAVAGILLYYGGDIINYIKAIFHRIRFREMIAYSNGLINEDGWSSRGASNLPREWIATTDFSAFDRWYKVGNDMGVYSEATSFPSGHTAAATFAMLLPALFSKCRALNKYFVPSFIIGFAYTLAMGVSRLIRGAHYLTDISAGAIIIFALMLLIIGIMDIFERKSEMSKSIIKDNMTILFQGDSITDCDRKREDLYNLGGGYPKYAAKYIKEKYPDYKLTFINKGISGDRSINLVERWKEDCIDLKPDFVSILIGINDTWRRYDSNDETTAAEYEKNFRYILEETKEKLGAKIMILSPFLIEVFPEQKQWREDLNPKIEIAKKLAREFGCIYVPLDEILAEKSLSTDKKLLSEDGVHPAEEGKKVIAKAYLKYL
ncbi:MAG: phosphatase PAP2 family protein [Eubacterium sp.]|nr:phosphatase PAP2 family protein [Eubacterium sp.]